MGFLPQRVVGAFSVSPCRFFSIVATSIILSQMSFLAVSADCFYALPSEKKRAALRDVCSRGALVKAPVKLHPNDKGEPKERVRELPRKKRLCSFRPCRYAYLRAATR